MKEIFTDLYKKVLGFFQSQEKEKGESDRQIACSRMKLVLMQDRTNLTPLLLERMRGEMIDVLSKYVEMNKDELELNFEQEGDSMALMLSIPVVRAKDEEEINAMIEKEEAEKAENAQKDEAKDETETEEETIENATETSETEANEEADITENEQKSEEISENEVSEDKKRKEISKEDEEEIKDETSCESSKEEVNQEEKEENQEKSEEEEKSDKENKKSSKKKSK